MEPANEASEPGLTGNGQPAKTGERWRDPESGEPIAAPPPPPPQPATNVVREDPADG